MAKVVGIDCGSTLRKYAWRKEDGALELYSTADLDLKESSVLDQLNGYRARVVGIGERPRASFAEVIEPKGDKISDEIALQAAGARWLLGQQGLPNNEFLIVSVGTGTSYTAVSGGKAEKLPFGNPIGGGFIAGLTRGSPLQVISDLVANGDGETLDLLYEDVFPDKAGDPLGKFVIAHFARKVEKRTAGQYYASVINTVAVAVARDLLMYRMLRPIPTQMVFIGTCVSMMPPLAARLQAYAAGLGFTSHAPANGEYSAAIGALLSGSEIKPFDPLDVPYCC